LQLRFRVILDGSEHRVMLEAGWDTPILMVATSDFSRSKTTLTRRRWHITRWLLRQTFPFPAHID
jgi:hypothetical protein